ncbi:MAG: TIGR04282 family arsenosugar biosynthesis glycosyltransferase [Thermodesulfobacteriota bacterium]
MAAPLDREAAAVVKQPDNMTNNLIIFVKYPEPGHVKTRIGKVIGIEKAADLYCSLANYIVSSLVQSKDYNISVFFTPKDRIKNIKSWFQCGDIDYFPQTGNSLGERISNAFEHSFSNGFNNTIIIGSDCIEINQEIVANAFKYLNDDSDCVVGPAHDGGYYLIGLKSKNYPFIFEDLMWSSDSVFDETMKKINYLNLNSIILEELNDIDNIDDLNNNVIKLVRNYYPNFEV